VSEVAVKSEIFSPDALEFLRRLVEHDVRFFLVGEIAVIYHGHARCTGVTDYLYQPSRRNAERLHAALLEFWAGSIPGDIGVEQLLEANQIF
jgi:hypothetical protein